VSTELAGSTDRPSTLQGTGLWGRLLGCFLGLDREIACHPFGNAALERGGSISLAEQLSDDLRARQLVRIGIVDHDFPIARERGVGTARSESNGARQLDGAVLEGILETSVYDDRRCGALEALLEIVTTDTRDSHGWLL